MRYVQLSDHYSVASQISPADVGHFAEQGYTTIICNRPDAEDPGQPPSAEIEAECQRHGLEFQLIPMQGRFVNPDTVERMRAALDESPGPVLAYCRSGTRSSIIWQMIAASQRP